MLRKTEKPRISNRWGALEIESHAGIGGTVDGALSIARKNKAESAIEATRLT